MSDNTHTNNAVSTESNFFAGDNEMHVTKRNGKIEIVSFDKILKRIKKIGQDTGIKINYTGLAMKVIDQLYDKISTTKIDELSAEQCASMASIHPDYNVLAGRIIISNHHRNTPDSFYSSMKQLYDYKDKHDKHSPLISQQLWDITKKNKDALNSLCNYERDYLIDYFGFKTLERAYLMKVHKKTVERPQHMWLRVAIGIHGDNMERVIETYELMSQKYFTHATPTLFNAGTNHPQLSSCFLLAMENDSIEGIYNTLKDCALISKWAGGIGLHIHNIRASGSHIRGTNGTSNGIVPLLRVFNNTARYVDQCVTPDTLIYTIQGPKQIKDCISGQTQIYGKTGQPEIIENVLEHYYDGELLNIAVVSKDIGKTETLHITPEHPVYVLRDGTHQWIEAKDICTTDNIIHSVPRYVHDMPKITLDDCYMYGILSVISHIWIESNETKIITTSDKNMKDFVINYLEKKCIEYSVKSISINGLPDEDEWAISFIKTVDLAFYNSDFINENDQLYIAPRWLNLPIEKIQKIVDGYIDYKNNYENMVLSSILPNYCCYDREYFYHCFAYLLLRLYGSIQKTDFIYSQIDSIQTTQYTGLLYDLQMTTQHNYLLSTGLVHNGGGKRNGSFAIYLEPWHADIEVFLQMRKNHGDEELKARDLFYALWIPDLFMERIKSGGNWTLMCPDECPGLANLVGDEFKELYEKYESQGKGRKTFPARELWFQIMDAQMETGTPYLVYKDAANKKSNQKNVGTIMSSNLCSEILEYSDKNESAVCNLASIALPSFVDKTQNPPVFNFEKLHQISKVVTYNLNRIIDVNYYPTDKTRRSNMRHRPIGIGVQGLADVFMMLDMPFSSEAAKQLNKDIFETIYHGAVESSVEIAKVEGPYETFKGSPASEGLLQFDLWKVNPTNARYNWDELKESVKTHGLRNSLLLAPMPTASTSQILGYNECIEPITSNIYSRRTLAGEFIIANKYLMNDLIKMDLWNEKIKNNIIANNGSIQQIDIIPEHIRDKYKTVWELPMRTLIDMAADRGAFICQSQSLNLWLEDPNYSTLTSMHFYAWTKGLKTGIYYLRRRGRHQAQQFTIEPEKKEGATAHEEDEICEMCSA